MHLVGPQLLKKCALTGALYGAAKTDQVDHPYSNKMVAIMKRRASASITMGGKQIPFYHPDKEPYTYLGVELTPTLNWSYQLDKVRKKALEKGCNVLQSFTTPAQTLQYVQSCIRPYLTYAFAITMHTPNDIAKLDSVLTRIAKKAYRLPVSTPNALVMQSRVHSGMGMTSLQVDYVYENTKYLLGALLDQGHLGIVTRSLLQLQHGQIGTLQASTPQWVTETRFYHLMWQHNLIRKAEVTLTAPEGETALPAETQLCQILGQLTYSPLELGELRPVHPKVYLPLLELGLENFALLMHADRTRRLMIPPGTRKAIWQKGKTKTHKLALNRLTLVMSGAPGEPTNYTSTAPLSAAQRTIAQDSMRFTEMGDTYTVLSYKHGIDSYLQRQQPTHEPAPRQNEPIPHVPQEWKENRPKKRISKRKMEAWQAQSREAAGFGDRTINEAAWERLYAEYLKEGQRKKKRRAAVVPHDSEAQTEATISSGLSLEDFIDWMTLQSTNPDILSPLYNESDIPIKILASRNRHAIQECLVMLQNSCIRKRHLPLCQKLGYKPDSTTPVANRAGEEWIEVQWKSTWEEYNPERQDPTMRELMQAYLEEKDNLAATNQQPRPRPPRKDGKLPNNKRQGHFIPPSKRPQQPLLHDPKLA